MSAAVKPVLTLVSPPQDADPVSIAFMIQDLARSGLTPEDIGAYPIGSKRYQGCGSYVIPYNTPTMYRTRHDRAVNKYLQPKGIVDIWWPHTKRLSQMREAETLYIIEGEKKAARFHKQWPSLGVVGIGGAWNSTEKADDGTRRLLPNLLRCLKPGMTVFAIFDGDIQTKPGIQQAATALLNALSAVGCFLKIYRPPIAKGVDDWLEADVNSKLEDLVAIPVTDLEESRKQLYKFLSCQMNDDKLVLNELNAKKLLEHYFAGTVYVDKRLGIIKDGELSDAEELETHSIEYVQGQINMYYKVPQIRQGLRMALTNQRDLVQEKVQSLEWDGVERLGTWGSEYFETTFPAYANDWGRMLMTGLGLRILRPGTKVDYAFILIGAQGIGKSTFFEELSTFEGMQFYYACTELSGTGSDHNRTQGQMFARSIIVDLAEGVVFETKKSAMDRAKQVITQTHDEFRVVFAKAPTVQDRGFIFGGTTNRTDQLGDQTGSRRFLNLDVTKITRLPYNIKMQLLAEVKAKEEALRASRWYEFTATVSDAPQKLKEDKPHIKNVQELVNSQYHKMDARSELFENLIESGDIAKVKGTDVLYVTAGYLSTRGGADTFADKHLMGRLLSALASSPQFPYELTPSRKRLPQLEMTAQQLFGYTSGINNAQQMITGFEIRKKYV